MKKNKINIFIKSFLFVFIFLIFLVSVFAFTVIITEFNPDDVSNLEISIPVDVLNKEEPFSVISWNVGYAGLGDEADFFLEGGKMSKGESKETVREHLENILNFLEKESPDILLLQEVDVKSSRSYYINQINQIKNSFPNYFSSFAFNYKILFLPIPLSDPIGSVQSGLFSLSSFKVSNAKRFSIASVENFPDRYFHLKRAVLLQNVELENKDLSIINIHLSAFVGQGIRDEQLSFLRQLTLDERTRGNAVIVAGDWNMELPNVPEFKTKQEYPEFLDKFPEDWVPEGFSFVFDKEIPTVRTNEQPYVEGENFRAIVDGFLVSDDVKVIDVKTFDLNFVDSDHNPIKIEFEIV